MQAGNVTGIIAGRKGKGQRGQVGYSTYVQVMVVLSDTTQSHKEWWSGAQLHPFVLCLSVTSQSCSEEPGPHHLHLSALFSSSDYDILSFIYQMCLLNLIHICTGSPH